MLSIFGKNNNQDTIWTKILNQKPGIFIFIEKPS